MADPIEFDESNFVYKRPVTMSEDECASLPCLRLPDQSRVISCWRLSEEEKKEINRTGLIYVDMYSMPPVPVAITGIRPFGFKESCPQCGSLDWGENFLYDLVFHEGVGDNYLVKEKGACFCDCGYIFPGGEMI